MNVQDILPLLPEVRDEGKGYKMFNDGSTELEVSEFLYGLVRVLKPKNILETGTYKGISSSFMGLALKENGFGKLETLEIEENHIRTAKELWNKLNINDWITSYKTSSLEFKPTYEYQLIFLDTEPGIRFQELVQFYPYISPGGYVGIHDLPRNFCQGNINPDHPEIPSWPFGPLPQEIRWWLKDRSLVPFHLTSPRGMVWFYKPRGDDYVSW